MIQELHIENFAIIDRLDLHLKPGFVILTGETGAGKSILIDAVEALLGSRVEAVMVRAEADKAIIEATFAIPPALRPAIQRLLEPEALWEDSEFVQLSREIRRNGRSVGRINGRVANLNLIRQLGELLVDVHGQSEHLSLLRVSQHIALLDRFADAAALQEAYTQVYRQLLNVRRELIHLRQLESESARQTDILNYQINEIESAHLKPDEEQALTAERNRLANAEGLASLTQELLLLLDEGAPDAPAAADLIGQALRAAGGLARLDRSQTSLEEQLQDLFERLQEVSSQLRRYLDEIEFNPKRLNQVEERLALIHSLKRKYGKSGANASIQEVLDYAAQARRNLEMIAHAGARLQELEQQERQLLEQLAQAGQALSHKRHEAALRLSQELEKELSSLNMEQAKFMVQFSVHPDPNGVTLADGQRVAFDANGLEQVEFLVAPNPGEGFKPLVKIASGGETSRLMLAIKNVLARADPVPTLIFDEIDQGIGGRVGTIVGHKLWQLSQNHQVLCVTHLPQLAAFGDQHLQVQKTVKHGRTITQVTVLEAEARLNELAQMMGAISEGTRRSAQELMQTVRALTAPR